MSKTVTVVLTGDDATWETAARMEQAVIDLFPVQVMPPKVVRTQHRGGGLGFVVSSGEPAPKRARVKPQPDPAVPVSNPDVPEPTET